MRVRDFASFFVLLLFSILFRRKCTHNSGRTTKPQQINGPISGNIPGTVRRPPRRGKLFIAAEVEYRSLSAVQHKSAPAFASDRCCFSQNCYCSRACKFLKKTQSSRWKSYNRFYFSQMSESLWPHFSESAEKILAQNTRRTKVPFHLKINAGVFWGGEGGGRVVDLLNGWRDLSFLATIQNENRSYMKFEEKKTPTPDFLQDHATIMIRTRLPKSLRFSPARPKKSSETKVKLHNGVWRCFRW